MFRNAAKEIIYCTFSALVLYLGYAMLTDRLWHQQKNEVVEKLGLVNAESRRQDIQLGGNVTTIDLPVRKRSRRILLFYDVKCQYCKESEGFYAKLADYADETQTPFVVLLRNWNERAEFRILSGKKNVIFSSWKNIDKHAPGTPCLILVGPDDRVNAMWLGRPDPVREGEIEAHIRATKQVNQVPRALLSGEEVASVMAVNELAHKRKAVVLNVINIASSAMPQVSSALTIPLEELEVRAPYEVTAGSLICLDCSMLSDMKCHYALEKLRTIGFEAIAFDGGRALSEAKQHQADANPKQLR